MANLFRRNPLAAVLAAVAALLVVVICIEVAVGIIASPQDAAPGAVAASDVKMIPPPAAVVPDQAYPETAARPLFTPTRRPAPAASAGSGAMVKGQFILTAVLSLRDQQIALLKEKTSGKVHRVERGKEINGMTLTKVEGERVTLAQGGDEEVLALQVQKSAAPAPGAPAAAAPAGVAPVATGGPFGPGPGAVPGAAPNPGTVPQPGAPVPVGVPVPPNPAAAPPVNPAAPNPAQRSGFGPFLNQPAATPTDSATPMTPEELLARRRARRGTQQPNQ